MEGAIQVSPEALAPDVSVQVPREPREGQEAQNPWESADIESSRLLLLALP